MAASPIEGFFRFVITEAGRHKTFMAVGFVVLALGVIFVGTKWPKVYTSSTSVYVEEENIIGPLMQGAAVQTQVADRSNIAREMIYGRKIMQKVVDRMHPDDLARDPALTERMIENIKQRTSVTGRQNLITIQYRDSDPNIAYQVTKLLADFLIAESLAAKARESASAFEFIDKQVQEYKAKLAQSEEELKNFREENAESGLGAVGDISRRNSELRTQLQEIAQDLTEARIRRASLVRQLSGEAAAANSFSRAERQKARIAELQSQLDTLRLSYHDTYPDIVQIKAQIEELRQGMNNATGNDGSGGRIDEGAISNPVYQELQRSLYETNTLIDTLSARHDQTQRALDQHVETGKRVQDYEARLDELTRDYEVSREIYADLTRRRESARVSMNLDREQKGLSMRIDEPAYIPHAPSGPRFLHFVLAGPLVGLLLPLGIVVALRKIDPRIRYEDRMAEELGLPLLGVVPHMATPMEIKRQSAADLALGAFLLTGIGFMVLLVLQHIGNQG